LFKGCGTAIITPFTKDGQIDEAGLRELVDFQEAGGVDAIVPCGTTGESATLNFEEHIKVIEIVIDQVKKVKVIAGTGSNSTHEAVELSRAAEDLGADFLLSISPYYNKPTRRGLVQHFSTIAEAVDVPIIVYNVPSRTGVNLPASTTLELSDIHGIVGIKEASGNIVQVMEIIEGAREDFSVLSGDDSMTFPMMAAGAKGVISVASNIVPEKVSAMVHGLLEGDLEGAREMNYRLLRLFKHLFLETNPIPVKTSLRLMGKPSGSFRSPMCDMEDENLKILKGTLADLGLI
jgi:4-hydroxy-tetrahydrodipicolinate synthase